MQDFPGNSNKQNQPGPREKVERVTSAEAVPRKRGLGRKFKETFVGGDARTAADHVLFAVVIPSVKDMMYDAFDSGMRSLIFGEAGSKRRNITSSGYSGLGHVSYDRMGPQTRPKPTDQRTLSRSARARHSFDDLVIPTRQEAEEVIDRLFDLLSRYGSVSVADLYELTGIQSTHTDMKWGWSELRGAKAVRLRTGGYLLDLPEPEPFT